MMMARVVHLRAVVMVMASSALDTTWVHRQDVTSWVFLERFCFDSSGLSTVEIDGDDSGSLLVYRRSKFREVVKASSSSLSLRDRMDRASMVMNATEWTVPNLRKPTFFYFVYANFDGPVDMKYRFQFVNPREGKLNREFSSDEIGIFPTAIGFFLLQTGLLAASAYRKHHQFQLTKKKNWIKDLGRIFIHESIVCEWIAQVLTVISYGAFVASGGHTFGMFWILTLSRAARACADWLLVSLVAALALGWTVFRRKIPGVHRIVLAVILTTYACGQYATLAWSTISYDPGLHSFYYDGPPGTFVACLRIAGAVWFFITARRTREKFFRDFPHAVGDRFDRIGNLGTLWLLSLPVAIAVAKLAAPVVRLKIFFLLDLSFFAFGQASILYYYDPTRSFAFHHKRQRPSLRRVQPTSSFVDVSGNKLVICDDEDMAHLCRIRRATNGLLNRVDALRLLSRDLGIALQTVHVDSPPVMMMELSEEQPRPLTRVGGGSRRGRYLREKPLQLCNDLDIGDGLDSPRFPLDAPAPPPRYRSLPPLRRTPMIIPPPSTS